MNCFELLAATEVILALTTHDSLPQVILHAQRPLVEMAITSFKLPWKVTRSESTFVVVTRDEEDK